MTRALAITAALALAPGCFTSWATLQATGTERVLDERVREERVPLPGVDERLTVSVPLDGGTVSLTCATRQYATDRVYHSAFRYGRTWKKWSGVMFLVEAALAFGFYELDVHRDTSDPMKAANRTGLIASVLLGADALGTAAIFFIPRKEIYTSDDRPVITPVRDDCPDGLVLEIAGTAFPVDAAGAVGEVASLALDDWMRTPTGSVALTFGGRALPLRLTDRERCAWLRSHHPEEVAQVCGAPGAGVVLADLPRVTTAILSVPTGTLTVAN